MTQDTYNAIRVEWCRISSDEQRLLIYQYIEGDGSGKRGSWMEFLQDSFEITSKYPLSQVKPKQHENHLYF